MSRSIANPMQAAAELARCRAAAERLAFAMGAAAHSSRRGPSLLKNGSLSAEEIYELAATPSSAHSPIA